MGSIDKILLKLQRPVGIIVGVFMAVVYLAVLSGDIDSPVDLIGPLSAAAILGFTAYAVIRLIRWMLNKFTSRTEQTKR